MEKGVKQTSSLKSRASKVFLASTLLFTGVTTVEVLNPQIGHTVEASSKLRYDKVLTYGSTGAAVKKWQTDMKKLGFKLSADGSYGPDARKKAKQFQKKYKLVQDGHFGPASQKQMDSLMKGNTTSKPSTNKPSTSKPSTNDNGLRYGKVLSYGMTGSAVTKWQKDMKKLGFNVATDGSYGPDARKKAKQFQKKYKLVQDGHFGPASQKKMDSLLKGNTTSKPSTNKPSTNKPSTNQNGLLYGKVLSYGMTGSAVTKWQKDMNKIGFNIAEDGSYGPDAQSKARQFQKTYGLAQDGHFGPASQKKMASILKSGDYKKPVADSSKVKKPAVIKGVLMASKQYPLPATYNPGENKTARSAFNQLAKAAGSQKGYKFTAFSTFRTYQYQKGLFDSYVKELGYDRASQVSAVPGHSEHQTGLAFDVGVVGKESQWLSESFGKTAEGKWLANNAHHYGFIIRYPKGKEHITGYSYEPWHLRYLGKDVATKVYKSGKTLEEYLGVK